MERNRRVCSGVDILVVIVANRTSTSASAYSTNIDRPRQRWRNARMLTQLPGAVAKQGGGSVEAGARALNDVRGNKTVEHR